MVEEEKKTVLVAVDESEESMYALSWCLNNLFSQITCTQEKNTTLVLLYIKPPPPLYASMDATGYWLAGDDALATLEKYGKDLANSVMTKAEAVYKSFNTHIKMEKKVGTGDAKKVICTAVEKLGADVLVMGSHDYGFLKRAFLGSVSDYCAKNVKCPLVVVKRPKNNASTTV